jgi:glutathione peroxidase
MFLLSLFGCGRAQGPIAPVSPVAPFHALKATDIAGAPVDLSAYKGHPVLIVNTASRCGHTPQYAKLQELYGRYEAKGLVILGFPSNDFMRQEPGDNAEIAAFCTKNYGVTFPMMSKVPVKGDDRDPVYQWLTRKDLNGALDSKVKWNFQKYLVDGQGRLIGVFDPGTDPLDPSITALIDANL